MSGTISLKAARIDKGLSQAEVATALSVNEKTISNWENEKSFPNGVQLIALCELYGRALDEIRLPKKLD